VKEVIRSFSRWLVRFEGGSFVFEVVGSFLKWEAKKTSKVFFKGFML